MHDLPKKQFFLLALLDLYVYYKVESNKILIQIWSRNSCTPPGPYLECFEQGDRTSADIVSLISEEAEKTLITALYSLCRISWGGGGEGGATAPQPPPP